MEAFPLGFFGRVLEKGCGRGRWRSICSRKYPWKMVGRNLWIGSCFGFDFVGKSGREITDLGKTGDTHAKAGGPIVGETSARSAGRYVVLPYRAAYGWKLNGRYEKRCEKLSGRCRCAGKIKRSSPIPAAYVSGGSGAIRTGRLYSSGR